MLLLLLFHNSPVTPRYPFREEGFAHYPQTYPHRYVNRGVGEKIPGFFLGEEGPRAGAEVGRGEALSVWTEVWSGRGEALSVRPEAGQLPQRGSQVGAAVVLTASKAGSVFPRQTYLPLPLGEVARRSRDGEGCLPSLL